MISPATAMVLGNVIYFKGDWALQIDPALTREIDFRITGSRIVSVPMMHQRSEFRWKSYDGFNAIELPYKGNDLSMIILLPEAVGGLPGFELVEILAAMGMPSAFGEADFSGITGSRDLYISNVVHEAFIDVDDEGTEAAASTAVVMTKGGTLFNVDHPFLFLIRENRSGSILFIGRIIDPTN